VKLCISCQQEKPLEAFPIDRKRKDGRYPYCRPCHAAKERRRRENPEIVAKKRASNKAWAARNPERVRALHRAGHLRKKYGLTQPEVDAILVAQDGVCALCRAPHPRFKNGWHIDHDHGPGGKVRGMLCQPCNHLIGHVEAGWKPPSTAAIRRYLRG